MHLGRVAAIACLVIGVLYYVLAVSGMLWQKPSPPGDVGLVSTAGVFVLFGVFGLLLRHKPAHQ